ncbi:GntR family transcriptional regulator [Novispirillum itersonii]|uniref:GntR family transcriptional regulator n=1 Tax=Novispirillum itersonii TaxID=189 RepID=UPI000376FF1E|nr:GntR family transcriptional regulator [Novispirillum itersonii]
MTGPSSGSTVQAVAESITEAVRQGQLAPGQRLIEADFTRRLGVSRSSVREAFQRLTADGLLSFVPNKGVTVRQYSRKEINDLFQVRAALESLAVRLATPALAASPAALHDVVEALTAAELMGDTVALSEQNRRFHDVIVSAADNPLLSQQLERLRNSVYWLQFRVLVDRDSMYRTNQQHRDMAAAILAGQSADAEAVMQAHVTLACTLIQNLPDALFAVEL